MLSGMIGKLNINKREFLVITLLFVSIFGWYYMAMPIINQFLHLLSPTYEENLAVWIAFTFSVIGSSIVGALLSNKLKKKQFLYAWTILGVIVSLFPMMVAAVSFFQVVAISLLLGISFGLGMPSCLEFFADSTSVENRGRIGGVSFLVANACVLLLMMVVNNFNLLIVSIVFSLVRALGLIIFFSKAQQGAIDSKPDLSFFSILSERSFLLYFVIWFIFPLVDRFESSLIQPVLSTDMSSLLEIMNLVEPLVGALTILVAGILCDLIGRKKVMLSGFVSLGFAYAIIGFFSNVEGFSFIWYFYFVIDAIAWGIFLLTFVLVIWGDLSARGSRAKYYALGSLPFFLGYIIPEMLTPSIIESIPLDAAFSMAALFLFVAFLPLVFAPETLPEKKMELRRLKSFAEEAKKAREKYESKN